MPVDAPSIDTALLTGILTSLPLIHIALFISVALGAFRIKSGHGQQIPAIFQLLVLSHLLTMVLVVGLLIYYIRHLFKTKLVPNDMKALWAVVLFLGNMIAMPVFWYHYIWTPAWKSNRSN